VLVLVLVSACGARHRPEYPPIHLTAPGDIPPGDFALEQEVTIDHPRGSETFRAVLERRGDRLLLLALAPHGGRGFALIQEGSRVRHEAYVPMELPFPPELILMDVHRTFLRPVAAPPAAGEREQRDGDEVVRERFRDGALVERRIRLASGDPPGELAIDYGAGLAAGAPLSAAPPDRVTFENGWLRYRAVIRTLSWTPLPADAGPGVEDVADGP
jgi:hypothetical protein